MILSWDTARTAMPLAWRFVVVLAAGTSVVMMFVVPPAMPRGEPAEGAPVAVPRAVVGPTGRSQASYPTIAEHPLFSSTRSPWVAPVVVDAPASPPGPLTRYTLVGVMVSDGIRRAMVRRGGDSKAVTLGEGESLEGWTLREITPQSLRFTTEGASYDMGFHSPSATGQ